MRAFFLRAFVFLTLLICGKTARPGEVREFTSKDGKTIKAEFLESAGGLIQIKRVSDGRLFVLEISSLSLDDQAWLAGELAPKAPIDDPRDKWSRLKVILQNPKDTFEVIGRDGGIARNRYGGVSNETHLPEGAWIKLYVLNEFGILEHFVRYEGAKQWTVSSDGPRVLLDRDGSGPELIGLTVELDEELPLVPEIEVAPEWSVEILSVDQIDMLRELKHPISGIVADGLKLTPEHLAKLAMLNPKALHVDVALADIGALSDFKKLEALRMWIKEVELTSEKGRAVSPSIPLPPMPALRDISFRFPAVPRDLPEVFAASTPMLRMFDCDATARSPQFPLWEDIGQLEFLESIHTGWGARFGAKTLATHPTLTSLVFGVNGMNQKDSNINAFEDNQNLRQLAIRLPKFPAEVIQNWARKGGLAKVRSLQTYQAFDFGDLNSVEILSLQRSATMSADFDIPSAGDLERLRFLSVHYANQEEVEAICKLPNRNQLEVVLLANGTYDDLSPLASLPNLKRLEISNPTLKTVDLGLFPNLEVFLATRMEQLVEVKNISNHPALMHLKLSGSKELKSLGPASPNNVLRCLELIACPELTDWEGLSGTNSIKQVHIYNCDGLADTLPIEKSNSIIYFYVNGCEQLANRSIN